MQLYWLINEICIALDVAWHASMARQKLFATALFASIILENSSGPHKLMGVFVDRRTEQKMVF